MFLLDPRSYFMVFDIYLPLIPVPRGFHVISLAFVLFLMMHRWNAKPLQVRRLLIASSIAIVPLYLFGSAADEIRALSFMFMPLYLAGFHTVQSLYVESDERHRVLSPWHVA